MAEATPNAIITPRCAALDVFAPATSRTGRARISSAAQDSASSEAKAATRREADSAASSGTTTSQIAANDSMPPVVQRNRHDQAGERQRRQHMGAFIAAGARQEPGQQDRRDQPGEGRDLDRARRAAHGEIDRKCGKRRQAAEQPRRHEGAMARARQRIVTRGGMQQRIETVADDTQNCSRVSRFGSIVNEDAPERLLYRCANRVRANLNER